MTASATPTATVHTAAPTSTASAFRTDYLPFETPIPELTADVSTLGARFQPLLDPAVRHPYNLVEVAGDLLVVRRDEARSAVDSSRPQTAEDTSRPHGVLVAARLVGEEETGAEHERARERRPLLLSNRRLAGRPALELLQPEGAQKLLHPLRALIPGSRAGGPDTRCSP